MSMTITKETFIRFATEKAGIPKEVIATILVDESNELPEAESGISGKILHQGSVAVVLNSDITAVLNGSGEWRNALNGEAIE